MERAEALRRLAAYYVRSGCLRQPNPQRAETEDTQHYKKGWEVRLVAYNEEELAQLRTLLAAAGFPVARSYTKVRRFIQPVYGREAVGIFRTLALAYPNERVV